MNFGGPPSRGPSSGRPQRSGRPDMDDDDDASQRMGGAAPPPCPRCDLVKTQATRMLTNQQKAYRKKFENLKGALQSSRASTDKLQKRVDTLSSPIRIHLPSTVLGIALGSLLTKHVVQLVKRLVTRPAAAVAASPEQQEEDEAAEDEAVLVTGAEGVVVVAEE